MIVANQVVVAINGNFAVSADFNFGPSSIVAAASLNGIFFGSDGVVFAGIAGFSSIEPGTGVGSNTDLRLSDFFNVVPNIFGDNITSVTFVTGANDTSGLTHVESSFQLYFQLPDGGLG